MAARHAFDISIKLDNLKRSVDDCHPQVPSLAVETASLIFRHLNAGNIDELFTDKSLEELEADTKSFEQMCRCEGTVIRKPIERLEE